MIENVWLYTETVFIIVLIAILLKYKKQLFWINTIAFLLYAAPLYYAYFNYGGGGSGFLWWFYLIVLMSIQILIIIIYFLCNFIKNKKTYNQS